MHEKKSISQRVDEFLGGKGFYIVLFVCIAVIGVSAWLLLFSRFSPLTLGDELDYVDAMGDNVTPKEPDAGGKADAPDTPGTAAQPEHQVPEDKKDTETPPKGTGTLAVQEEPKETPGKTGDAPSGEQQTGEPSGKDTETAPGAAAVPEDIAFAWPVNGKLSVGYSPDALIYSRTMGDWRTHDGIDIEVTRGTKVLSCASGTVTAVYTDDMLGTTVVIDHGAGVVSTCSNLAAEPTVKEGDSVTVASVIGSVGSTALGETADTPHLHFSLTVNGQSVDPTEYLPKK